MEEYKKTQTGYFLIILLSAGLFFSVSVLMVQGFEPGIMAVAVILALCLLIFSTLSVSVGGDEVKIIFGPGIIRKTILLNDIET